MHWLGNNYWIATKTPRLGQNDVLYRLALSDLLHVFSILLPASSLSAEAASSAPALSLTLRLRHFIPTLDLHERAQWCPSISLRLRRSVTLSEIYFRPPPHMEVKADLEGRRCMPRGSLGLHHASYGFELAC